MSETTATSRSSKDVERAYLLGKRDGRQEMLNEIYKALGLDEKIAKAIAEHEDLHHGG